MKIQPVSADLLIKVGLGLLVVGVVVYAGRKVASVGGNILDGTIRTAADVLNKVNPTSAENVAYQTANIVGGEMVGPEPDAPGKNADGSWSLGGWIYDVTH